ncbi:MAG: hypothetical protein KAQ62_08555, partial [Cyclobacteriaceae bacterium]|nr:hypothetical protein [Cyclobacteriaceae bacterium]
MKKVIVLILFISTTVYPINAREFTDQKYAVGKPGLKLTYSSKANDLPGSVVRKLELTAGSIEEKNGIPYQWIELKAEKENTQAFSVWMLASAYPSETLKNAQNDILRYILLKTDSIPIEFINQTKGGVVLPNTGAWEHLLPRTENGEDPFSSLPNNIKHLGHEYKLEGHKQSDVPPAPKATKVISLTPDLLIGVPHNAKVKDETRRYDESDYEYIPL